jgi:hypothetical protein
MECRRKKITEGFAYTQDDLKTLEAEYEGFLNQFGRGKQTSSIVLQLANLEALLHQQPAPGHIAARRPESIARSRPQYGWRAPRSTSPTTT